MPKPFVIQTGPGKNEPKWTQGPTGPGLKWSEAQIDQRPPLPLAEMAHWAQAQMRPGPKWERAQRIKDGLGFDSGYSQFLIQSQLRT